MSSVCARMSSYTGPAGWPIAIPTPAGTTSRASATSIHRIGDEPLTAPLREPEDRLGNGLGLLVRNEVAGARHYAPLGARGKQGEVRLRAPHGVDRVLGPVEDHGRHGDAGPLGQPALHGIEAGLPRRIAVAVPVGVND